MVKPRFLKQETDTQRITIGLQEQLPKAFSYLESLGCGTSPLVGGAFSVADIAAGAMLRTFQIAEEIVNSATWPGLCAYSDRVLSRDSFQDCAAFENKVLR